MNKTDAIFIAFSVESRESSSKRTSLVSKEWTHHFYASRRRRRLRQLLWSLSFVFLVSQPADAKLCVSSWLACPPPPSSPSMHCDAVVRELEVAAEGQANRCQVLWRKWLKIAKSCVCARAWFGVCFPACVCVSPCFCSLRSTRWRLRSATSTNSTLSHFFPTPPPHRLSLSLSASPAGYSVLIHRADAFWRCSMRVLWTVFFRSKRVLEDCS